MICISDGRIKICNRAVDDCIDCVTGSRVRVPRLTGTELVDYAFRSKAQLQELSCIFEELIKLYKNSRLGEANKIALFSLISRFSEVQDDMCHTSSTVVSNLFLNEGSNATSEG